MLKFRYKDQRAIRMQRIIYAGLVAALHFLFCLVLFLQGMFNTTTTQFIAMFGLFFLVDGIFLYIFLSGKNYRFKDPSLTLPQMTYGITIILITVFFAEQLRSILLMLVLFALVFGAFRLTRFQFNMMALYASSLYLLVIYLIYLFNPEYSYFKHEIIRFFAFAILTFSFSTVATELSSLREHLRTKSDRLTQLLRQVETESLTDDLIGIRNRRFLFNMLHQQRLFSERGEYTFSVLMLDLDHFKSVNDKYGHKAGDNVLIAFADIVSANLRKIDYFGRLGGEEFLVIAPFTKLPQALVLAERIRVSVENANFEEMAPEYKHSVSIGVTLYHWPESIDETLDRVDKALYSAKMKGRNRIEVL